MKRIENLGNTCYLNSTLQILFNYKIFNNIIIASNNNIQDKLLSYEYYKLISNNNNLINPEQIYNKILKLNNNLKKYYQEDAEELLTYIINRLYKELQNIVFSIKNTQKKKSIKQLFNYIFRIEIDSIIKCLECTKQSHNNEIMNILNLPINNNTLNILLDDFFKNELLINDNKYECNFCKKKVNAVKNLNINKLPYYLLLSLKRFNMYYKNNILINEKILKKVNIPLILKHQKLNNITYTLKSIIIHIGNSKDNGHYINISNKNNKWYLFNDSNEIIELNNEDLIKYINIGYIYLYEKNI